MWRLIVFICCVSVPALAQDVVDTGPDLRDVMNARNVGMGGAYEALGYGAEAAYGNPAAMSLYRRYQTEVTGAWDTANGYGMATVGIVDSQTSNVAAGITYHFVTFGDGERRWAHLTGFALAMPLAEFLHIGLSAQSEIITGASETNSITMTGGIVVRPIQFLTLGFSAHNFIPVYNKDVTLYFVGSAGMMLASQLTAAFDVRIDPSAPNGVGLTYCGGLEWLAAQAFPLRGGFEYDDVRKTKYVSAGIGYFQEGSGVDFSYRHEIGGGEGRMFALTLKLQM